MIKRVLIIDNDLNILELFGDIFDSDTVRVSALQATDNIFADIALCKPHLIILDYMLDGGNGGEICHKIKTNPATSKLPVIIISTFAKAIGALGYFSCDKFIAKPFDIFDLIGQAENLMGLTQGRVMYNHQADINFSTT